MQGEVQGEVEPPLNDSLGENAAPEPSFPEPPVSIYRASDSNFTNPDAPFQVSLSNVEGTATVAKETIESLRSTPYIEDRWLSMLSETPPRILPEVHMRLLCQRVKSILLEENNIHPIEPPVVVCGDTHGQFYDVRKMFNASGEVPDNKYLFLGDYVDRGYNSVETFSYLMVLKCKYPDRIFLIRGNHESRCITHVYGFFDEVMRKYGEPAVWRYCTDVFDYLGIGAIIAGRIFAVHGGLSPEIKLVDQLRLIYRVQEVPQAGPFGDVLWSDPHTGEGWAVNPRGAGFLFGSTVTEEFMQYNDLAMILRAHQMCEYGFSFSFDNEQVCTIWSAPNYCYRCGNAAATFTVETPVNGNIKTFQEAEENKFLTYHQRRSVPYFV